MAETEAANAATRMILDNIVNNGRVIGDVFIWEWVPTKEMIDEIEQINGLWRR